MKEFKFGRGFKNKLTPLSLLGGNGFFTNGTPAFSFSGSTMTQHDRTVSYSHRYRPNISNREGLNDYAEHFDRICEYIGESIQRNTETPLQTQHGTFSILSMAYVTDNYELSHYRVVVRHWPREWTNRWIESTIYVTNDLFLSDMVYTVNDFRIEQETLPF